MKNAVRVLIPLGFLLAGFLPNVAEEAVWTADPDIGANRLETTIELACTGSLACSFLDGYSSTRSPELSGGGLASVNQGGTFEIRLDRLLDLPPVVPAWVLDVADTEFDPIPLVGTPQLSNAVLFGTTGGPFTVPDLTFGPFGPAAIAETLDTGFRFDLLGVGDPLLGNVAGPDAVQAVADFEMIDGTRFEVRNLFWDIEDQQTIDLNPGTLTAFVIGNVTLNLSGEILFQLTVEPAVLSWTATSDATGVDIVRGDLSVLRQTGDLTAATAECLGSDVAGELLETTGDPPPGEGSWYLARRRTAAGVQTYDVPFAGQVASRDAAIAESPSACP
jgi:hypothetical protein